ncbi:MAG: hypothetical protein ACPGYT_05285 [Nitrospirales bacterium]
MMFEKRIVMWEMFFVVSSFFVMASCSHHAHHSANSASPTQEMTSTGTEPLISLNLDSDSQKALNAVMREHLEAVHQIVEALGKDDFQHAHEVTANQLGMAKHRDAMRRQMPRNFPPDYHDLAMAHHHAAEDLATTIPTKNLPYILSAFAKTLDACVACHRVYKR